MDDYKEWLRAVDIDANDHESPSDLVHSLRNCCECGLFNTQVAKGTNNGWIISASCVQDKLHLKTPKQMTAFIRHIEHNLCEDMDAEVYASYKHAMEKDD